MNQHLDMVQHDANYHNKKPIPIQIRGLAVSTPHPHRGIVRLAVHYKDRSATNEYREHQPHVFPVVAA